MVCLEKLLLLVLTVQLVNSQKHHSPKSKGVGPVSISSAVVM
ncbi:unnamed protein product [Allacma fusca]|uniref:Uncharacterized protein n=1 Tax=Allacma fusca TaxID=39272 RepID=A0A8J2K263_9HEXA|nr:unnamed protein product [Allacma fusca]